MGDSLVHVYLNLNLYFLKNLKQFFLSLFLFWLMTGPNCYAIITNVLPVFEISGVQKPASATDNV